MEIQADDVLVRAQAFVEAVHALSRISSCFLGTGTAAEAVHALSRISSCFLGTGTAADDLISTVDSPF
jgi:hypothetical protein